MIVVKVELWPGGDADAAQSLGILCIANVGPPASIPRALAPDELGTKVEHNNADLRLYDVELQEYQTGTTRVRPRRTNAEIEHFRRKGWKRLVTRAFEAVDRG